MREQVALPPWQASAGGLQRLTNSEEADGAQQRRYRRSYLHELRIHVYVFRPQDEHKKIPVHSAKIPVYARKLVQVHISLLHM